jgi:hypothetical protein
MSKAWQFYGVKAAYGGGCKVYSKLSGKAVFFGSKEECEEWIDSCEV